MSLSSYGYQDLSSHRFVNLRYFAGRLGELKNLQCMSIDTTGQATWSQTDRSQRGGEEDYWPDHHRVRTS